MNRNLTFIYLTSFFFFLLKLRMLIVRSQMHHALKINHVLINKLNKQERK